MIREQPTTVGRANITVLGFLMVSEDVTDDRGHT